MKKKFLFFLTMILLFILSGCITKGEFKAEPSDEYSTLVIGQINMTVSGYDGERDFGYLLSGVDGKYTFHCDVILTNITTNKSYKLDSNRIPSNDNFAFFFSKYIGPGDYTLDYVLVEKTISPGVDVKVNYNIIVDNMYTFKVEEGKVNNLGQISSINNFLESIKIDEDSSDIKAETYFDLNKNYELVQKWFVEAFPESVWNQKEWININLTSLNKKYYD